MIRLPVLIVLLVVQALCAGVFLFDLLSSLLGLRNAPISWQVREIMEIAAAVGLVIGFALGAVILFRAHRRNKHIESQLRAASGAFTELMEEKFTDWGLTAAERDVALFAIKGMSLSEIAALRSTSEGTVKAQSNAIYRKAGVSGRTQLLSLFIEDLMDEGLSLEVSGS